MSKRSKKHDPFCARNFAVFGTLLLTSLALLLGPAIIEYAPLHIKIGFGLLFSLAIAVYVTVYLNIRQDEE